MSNSLFKYISIMIEQNALNFGKYSMIFFVPEIAALSSVFLIIFILGTRLYKNLVIRLIINIITGLVILANATIILCLVSHLALNNSCYLTVFSNNYQINVYTQCIKLVINTTLLCILPYVWLTGRSKAVDNVKEVYLLLSIGLFLSYVIISTSHYVTLLLALEGFSLILYVLATVDRSYGGVTASVKYFTFGTLGSIFLFWGGRADILVNTVAYV